MWETWNDVFRSALGVSERNFVSELRGWRNKWAHQERYSSRDADGRWTLRSVLLTASLARAEEIEKIMLELRRLTFEEQVRSEKKKVGGSLIESAAAGSLKPSREVVSLTRTSQTDDISWRSLRRTSGRSTSDRAAPSTDPKEFFRRTYLTESLKRLLVGAVRRVNGEGGDPVVQLQTNFGGGKTHSMLALYHLFSGTPVSDLAGVDTVIGEAGAKSLPKVRRVVLVGNKISPGNPVKSPMTRWSTRCGVSWPGSSAERKRSAASRTTMRRRRPGRRAA